MTLLIERPTPNCVDPSAQLATIEELLRVQRTLEIGSWITGTMKGRILEVR